MYTSIIHVTYVDVYKTIMLNRHCKTLKQLNVTLIMLDI